MFQLLAATKSICFNWTFESMGTALAVANSNMAYNVSILRLQAVPCFGQWIPGLLGLIADGAPFAS